MKVIKSQSKHLLSIDNIQGISLDFSSCEVIDNILNSLRQQLLQRDAFLGATLLT